MERRAFLEKSFLTSLGVALSSSLFSSCRKETLFADTNFNGKILIIGAGAAGLYAGYMLKSRGIDFTILEASESVGGRLGKKTDFADYPIDLGAQWLHGRNSILGGLVQKSKTKITKDTSDAVYWLNNEITSTIPLAIDSLMAPNADLPDISFRAYAEQMGWWNEYSGVVEQLAGDFGADANEVSIKWTAVEEENWNSGNSDFKFQDSFFDLIDRNITKNVVDSIVYNSPISLIDFSGNQVQVIDQSGSAYSCDKVIITVPITILQEGSIEFVPQLPVSKIAAFGKIGMGAAMKVFLKFQSKFYDENIIGGTICAAYADEIVGKEGNDNVLLAFLMGEQAEFLSSLGSDQAIINTLLSELDGMYNGQASATFVEAHVEDWTKKPFIKGGYSFSKVGIGDARALAAEPVDNKLFFAGEAMNVNGHHQTVHGALETGYREVIRILNTAE